MTKKIEEKLLDKLEETLLAVRQSTPDSLSPILNEIRNKTDTNGEALEDHIKVHEDDIKDIKEQNRIMNQKLETLTISVKPAVSAIDTANGLKRGVSWIAGFIIALGSITGGIMLFKDWLKK